MKNLFLTLALLLTVSFAFAGNITPKIDKGLIINPTINLTGITYTSNNNQFSNISFDTEKTDNEDYPCRWRICTYKNGVKVGCTPWEYGECLDTVNLGSVKNK